MTGVILFRAQPLHNGHMSMIQKAYRDCARTNSDLHIFIGSADKSGTKRNPLPIELRERMVSCSIYEAFESEELSHIFVHTLSDLTDETDNSYNWGRYLFIKMLKETQDPDMTIYYSDDPAIMLGWFDEDDRWLLRFKFLDRVGGLSATKVRDIILNGTREEAEKVLPNYVYRAYYDEIKKYLLKADRREQIK